MKKLMFLVSVSTLLTFSTNLYAQQNQAVAVTEVKTVSQVDLKRYSGNWFEIARYPNKFQKKCVGNTTATYSIKAENTIEVINKCVEKDGTSIEAKGKAKVVDSSGNAKLKVRFAPALLSFIPAVWGDYWIVDLDENYQYAAVGDPKREYFWILSRTPEISDAIYQNILRRAEKMGFDPGQVVKTPQNLAIVRGAAIPKQ